MKNLQNLHTHCRYCDGADSTEEMVLAAIEKGFDSLGFSCHSPMFFSPTAGVSPTGILLYRESVALLKKKYADKIKLYCGLEVEMLSNPPMDGYDYLIGSVHYFKFGNRYVGFDRNAQTVKKVIDEEFSGDGMKYAVTYYEYLSQLPQYGKFDIIGHFDLITKHCENESFFDTESKIYRDAALSAAHALAGKIPFFEVNTGAISRKYRTTPYPQKFILKELKALGFGAIISSDCHNKNFLDCGFDDARELLAECGFSERFILTDSGFCAVEL